MWAQRPPDAQLTLTVEGDVSAFRLHGPQRSTAEVLGFAAVFLVMHNMYVHMDVDWGHGPVPFFDIPSLCTLEVVHSP